MDKLVEAFKAKYPKYKQIFYVTIPPGKELKWILKGGVEIHAENSLAPVGFQLTVMPDVYTTVNKGHMDKLAKAGLITRFYTYAHNRLVLMVSSDDPLAGKSLSAQEFYDLMSDPNVTISEPDILTQGIERHIWQMYTATSQVLHKDDAAVNALKPKMFNPKKLAMDPGKSLRRIVYEDKVKAGSTLLTSIHHLETPAYIRAGKARLGPVWVTEVLYQQNRLGKKDLGHIEIGAKGSDGKYLDRREKVNYLATIVEGKMDPDHKQAALDWIQFLRSPKAQKIFENVGFMPATAGELAKPFVYPDAAKNQKVGEY
jgi:ABC-type molybdate transport system substrate-binding protein